jgi:hypothetical protein
LKRLGKRRNKSLLITTSLFMIQTGHSWKQDKRYGPDNLIGNHCVYAPCQKSWAKTWCILRLRNLRMGTASR